METFLILINGGICRHYRVVILVLAHLEIEITIVMMRRDLLRPDYRCGALIIVDPADLYRDYIVRQQDVVPFVW